jgi:PKD repeat protein
VLGADDGGEANLVYTWAVQGSPPAAVSFSANGTNAAKNTTATFTAAGTYNVVVTLRDAGGQTIQSTFAVVVNQTITSISVSPESVAVDANSTQQFAATAADQFGNPLAVQPAFTWSIGAGGVGTVNSTGLYQAPAAGGGAAVLRAASSTFSDTATITVSPVGPGAGTGLAAVYFNNADLTGTSVVRTDAVVNFDFGAVPPDPFIAADTFSARWVGFVEARFSETYTFSTSSDDGVRLWVNDVPIIDQWNDHTPTRHSGTVALVAGQRYAIRMEYYQNAGPAVIGLEWQSPSQPAEVVPQSRLYSAAPIRVNFQPPRAPVPSGYVVDSGAIFADRGNGYAFGWTRKNSNGRKDRNRTTSPDQRYDTFLPLRKPAWEIAVANGPYRVHVVSGDPKTFRGAFKATIEGSPIIDGAPNTTQRWLEGWADVTVSDGRLTISSAVGARKNKINFVDILPLAPDGGATLASAQSAPALLSEGSRSNLIRPSVTRDVLNP